jgi:hypothetical protein
VLANMSAGSVHLDLKAFSGAYDLLSGARQRDGIVLPAYGLVWLIREA